MLHHNLIHDWYRVGKGEGERENKTKMGNKYIKHRGEGRIGQDGTNRWKGEGIESWRYKHICIHCDN
jgi:hypothetical protein